MAILWLLDMLHSFLRRCDVAFSVCVSFTCQIQYMLHIYRFPFHLLYLVVYESLLMQSKNKLISLSQQVVDYLFTFLPNCLAQLVVVFVALQRYVANGGVAECPQVNKVCNSNNHKC